MNVPVATTRAITRAVCAAIGTLALAPISHAQSSVTLYGLISTGIQYTNNNGGHSLVSMANGGLQSPRWGMKGKEDLGGGTSAIFSLENGFSITNGSLGNGGRMFGRQAFVGLSNQQYGTVTFGRQYEEMAMQLFWGESSNVFVSGPHIGDTDNLFNTVRINNSVRYASPTFGGLSFAGDYAFSNSDGFSNNNAYSFGGNYVIDRLKLGVAFTQYNRRSNAVNQNLTAGAVDSSGWGFSSPFTTSRLNASAGTDQQRLFGTAASYDFGVVKAAVSYTNVLFNYSDSTGFRIQNAEVYVTRQIRPDWLVGLAYIYSFGHYSDGTDPRYHQVNFGTFYSLSKRTDLFVWGVYQHAAGDAKFAYIYGTTRSTTKSQVSFETGIRHRF